MNWVRHLILWVIVLFVTLPSIAQRDSLSDATQKVAFIEQTIELISENLEAEDIDFNTLFDEIEYRLNHPINLNKTDGEELRELLFVNELQIQALQNHKRKNGPLLSVYELQGVDGFDVAIIQNLAPFVTINRDFDQRAINWDIIKNEGKQELVLRNTWNLEEQEGFSSIEDSLLEQNPNSRYLGDRNRLYARYRYRLGNVLSAGFIAEKDPGEQFFRGTQPRGFDYYSGHVYLRNRGKFRHIAVGDFQVQFGQGVTMWSGLAFGKSADILSVKRNAPEIRPYTSVDENNFLRGGAVMLQFEKWRIAAFGSYKALDANVSAIDSLDDDEQLFTSVISSGFHRTPRELEGKDQVNQLVAGGRVARHGEQLTLGVTGVMTQFERPLTRNLRLYNQFGGVQDQQNANVGLDFNYFFRNINAFGEIGMSANGGYAGVVGALMAVNRNVNFVVYHRQVDKSFQNQFGNMVREYSSGDERGTFYGISAKLNRRFRFQGYFDLFKSRWLTYLSDAPSTGADFLGQLDYSPSRGTLIYARYRREDKTRNLSGDESTIRSPNFLSREYGRIHFQTVLNSRLSVRSRVELSRYSLEGESAKHGVLLFQDLNYDFAKWPIKLRLRYALFDTESFNARIYAYENDVLYAFSVPAYFYRGSRIYVMAKIKVRRKVDVWLRWGQWYYSNRDAIGSGLNEIAGPVRNEFKVQMRYTF